jgi:hypothetical protein
MQTTPRQSNCFTAGASFTLWRPGERRSPSTTTAWSFLPCLRSIGHASDTCTPTAQTPCIGRPTRSLPQASRPTTWNSHTGSATHAAHNRFTGSRLALVTICQCGPGPLVLAPGCKTGEMAAKRWPFFPELAERLDDVALVGTRDDLPGRPFPAHVRLLVDRLTLRQTAQVLASAGVVVGNDSGLSHVAGAVGTPTLMLFGPTSHQILGTLPPNVRVLRAGLACEPCWSGARFGACAGQVTCLAGLSVDVVERQLSELLS